MRRGYAWWVTLAVIAAFLLILAVALLVAFDAEEEGDDPVDGDRDDEDDASNDDTHDGDVEYVQAAHDAATGREGHTS